MKRYFLAVILVIGFSFNSCSDDDDFGGDPSIKFTDKFNMTEWQREFPGISGGNEFVYIRFEMDSPLYMNRWNYIESRNCWIIDTNQYLLDNWPNPEITVLVNTENYLKYDIKLYRGYTELVFHYTISYKNGMMEISTIVGSIKLGTKSWERSEIDLNTLDECEQF